MATEGKNSFHRYACQKKSRWQLLENRRILVTGAPSSVSAPLRSMDSILLRHSQSASLRKLRCRMLASVDARSLDADMADPHSPIPEDESL